MRRIDILLLYEHVARELDVACAIKYLVESRYGLQMEIVQQPFEVPFALREFRPRMVALPFCYADSTRHYPFIFDWKDAIYFNMAWEELFYAGNREAKRVQGEFESKHVMHHAWGDFFVKTLLEWHVPRDQIFLNGQPAYRLYDEPYRAYFDSRADLAIRHRLDPSKKWVFFPENYNWAFYPEWRLDDLEKEGLERGQMTEMARFCRDSFGEVIRWCGSVAQSPEIELIIRPRPTTPIDEFRASVESLLPSVPSRMHLIKDETVREWILASDIVFSSYSTSLIEAAVANKTVFMVEPFPIPGSLYVGWQDHVTRIKKQREFEEACVIGSSERDNRLSKYARDNMMAHGDAIGRLADFFVRMSSGAVTHPAPPKRSSLARSPSPWLPSSLYFEYRRLNEFNKRRDSGRKGNAWYERDQISRAEIDRRTRRWESFLGTTRGLETEAEIVPLPSPANVELSS